MVIREEKPEDIEELDLSDFEYVILSDYNKGVLDAAPRIIKHCNKHNCKVIVDPKRHADHYKGAWLVKPNAKEFIDLGMDNSLTHSIYSYLRSKLVMDCIC